jgi:uncharacterized protein (TIGR02996 family)
MTKANRIKLPVLREEEAFVRPVLATPDDDAPRLMYADWLEELDDPRGDYLRLLAQLEEPPAKAPERALPLRLRELRKGIDPPGVRRSRGRQSSAAGCSASTSVRRAGTA